MRKMYKYTCKNCCATKEIPYSIYRATYVKRGIDREFCNNKCKNEYRTKQDKIKEERGDKLVESKWICKHCGKIIKLKQHMIDYYNRKGWTRHYCGDICERIHRKEQRVKVTCEVCGTVVYRKASSIKSANRFCNNPDCKNKAHSERMKGHGTHLWKGGKVKLTCTICGDCYYEYPSHIERRTTCGKPECWIAARSGELSSNWNNGSSFEPYPITFNNVKKKEVRSLYGNVCVYCGKPETSLTPTGRRRKLAVHHIDYDKANVGIDNLVPLCVECHGSTNHVLKEKRDYYTKLFKAIVKVRLESLISPRPGSTTAPQPA